MKDFFLSVMYGGFLCFAIILIVKGCIDNNSYLLIPGYFLIGIFTQWSWSRTK